jgi:hypothetical protein
MRVRPALAGRVFWDLFRIPLLHRHLGSADPAPAPVEQPKESTNA